MINITDKIVGKIPKREFNGGLGEGIINWFGEHISTPENRVIIGATALLSQPFFDYYNKDVDEKTRKVSCARTIGKIIAGTLTGYTIRAGFVKLVKNYSELTENESGGLKKIFTPSIANKDMPFAYKQYRNAMGMLFAIAGLTIAGFVIDAPMTNAITNAITKRMGGGKDGK